MKKKQIVTVFRKKNCNLYLVPVIICGKEKEIGYQLKCSR